MNFLLIAVCLFAGWSIRRAGLLGGDAYKSVNAWILYVALPAVALHYIPSISWGVEILLPLAMPVIVFAGAWIFFRVAAPRLRLSAETTAALVLTAGLGNTSFIGFPLTQAYFGDEGLRIAVMCDQMTFITLSTLGVLTAMHTAHKGNASAGLLAKKILLFPPFIGFVAALVLPPFIDLRPVDPLFEKLSLTLVPLALFSVGLQLRFSEWKNETKLLSLGLLYKLVIAPSAILALAAGFSLTGITAQTSLFEASMPPMITAAILAAEYDLNPQLATRLVSVGIVLSLFTSFLWWFLAAGLLP